jgi:uncharacterized protein
MAHSPPLHIHDLEDRAHRGFRSFRYLMAWACPRWFLHGHVDTWDNRKPTETMYHKTKVINVNPYKLLTLEQESHR